MQQKRSSFLCSAVCLCSLGVFSANAQKIAWVTRYPTDSNPGGFAQAVGFTKAPDIGYTDLLTANGYTVTRIPSADEFNVSTLLGYDLVIIGRSVNSGNFGSATESAAWNGLAVKLIDMGGYVMRGTTTSNGRLGWTTGTTMVDTAGDVTLHPTEYHEIFSGVPLDGFTGNMFNSFATGPISYTISGTNVTARGISVNMNPLAGGGTVLATVGTASDPTFGGTAVAIWDPGSVMNRGDVLGSWRMAFLSGTREAAGISGDGGNTSGIFDLTPDGAKVFLNAVDWMITVVPEPSSISLIAFGSLALLLRRKRS